MKILVYIFLIYINFCTSGFIHHGSKLSASNYPKKVQPGMLQYLKGTNFKEKSNVPGIVYTAWPTTSTLEKHVENRRFFPPFEKTYVDETNMNRRVKKILQAYSVFGPKRSKRAVDQHENVQGSVLIKTNPENPLSLKAQPSGIIAKNGNRRRGALRSGGLKKKKGKVGKLRQKNRVRLGKPGFQRRARARAMNRKKTNVRKRKNIPVKATKRLKLRKRFIRERSAKEGHKQMKSMAVNKRHSNTGLHATKQDARRLMASRDARIEEYPYVVSIQKGNEHWCAGAILNPRLVISTANCFWKGHRTTHMHIHAGSRFTDRGGQTAKIQEIMKHPMWRLRSGPDYDVAMMLLDRNLKFSHSLHSVDLPNRDMMPAFEDAWVASWGATRRDGVYDDKSSTLQVYHARLMSRNKCNNVTQRFGVSVSENFICLSQTGRRSPCTRDTGAPAVSDGVLWGLASWGIRKLCGTDRYPAMFSYIASDANMDFIANASHYLMSDERFYPFLDAGPREVGHAIEPYA